MASMLDQQHTQQTIPAFKKPKKEQGTIYHLCIGHTGLMHSFILKLEEEPDCRAC